MKKALYVLIPIIIIAAAFFYLYKTQPEIIPFLDDDTSADSVLVEDTAAVDMSEEQPAAVIETHADSVLADTNETLRTTASEDEDYYSQQEEEAINEDQELYGSPESWNIIVASVETEEMAQKLLQLPAYSNMEYEYVAEVGSYRILAFSGESLLEAQQQLTDIQARFPEAWIAKF